MLIKPFTAPVDGSGHAIVTVTHGLHGLSWKVYQLGLGLGQVSALAQTAAHINGIPLASTIIMQQSVFASLTGQAPYAMESFFVGPPYVILSAGDQLTVGVIKANPGDVFTVGAYIEEFDYMTPLSMGS